MKLRLASICATFLAFSACSDSSSPSDPALFLSSLNGTYRGTFTITGKTGYAATGVVTFTFTADAYECHPETMYLPPAGAGKLTILLHTIVLRDTVPHTAEFDWTLILNGPFSYAFDGTHLVLVQDDETYQRHRVIDLTRQ